MQSELTVVIAGRTIALHKCVRCICLHHSLQDLKFVCGATNPVVAESSRGWVVCHLKVKVS